MKSSSKAGREDKLGKEDRGAGGRWENRKIHEAKREYVHVSVHGGRLEQHCALLILSERSLSPMFDKTQSGASKGLQ